MKYNETQLGIEHKSFEKNDKLAKVKNQSLYPLYLLPSSRDFERLVYYLFKNTQLNLPLSNRYDEVWLLQGSKDKGRDVQLNFRGNCVGIVQCKKYNKTITESQIVFELVKYTLLNLSELNKVLQKRDYVLASIYGVNDLTKEFINKFNNSEIYEVEATIKIAVNKLVTDKHYSFSQLVYDEIRVQLLSALHCLHIIAIDTENISHFIDEDLDTKRKFFEVDKVIDQAGFNEVLSNRNRVEIEKFMELTSLEKTLQEKDKGLSYTLEAVKQKATSLIDDYKLHFIAYSKHNGKHTEMLPRILSTILGHEHKLNPDELFVLLAASILTDIGICQQLDSFDENDLRANHHDLSAEFVKEKGSLLLGIPEKYISTIQLLVKATGGILNHPSSRLDFSSNFSTESFCVNRINQLYLASVLWLADSLDISNMNSKALIEKYVGYPGYGISLCLWSEVDFNLKSDVDNERITYEVQEEIKDQLIYLSLCHHISRIGNVIEIVNLILAKEGKSIKLKYISNGLKSGFKKRIGISVDSHNILRTLLGKKLYSKEIDAVRELVQNAIDSLRYSQEPDDTKFIQIVFRDGKLIVKDNGIGMDEEIVSNYFAKIGRSYQTERQNSIAIGRFGIGVFSYFMLSSTFIVETRTRKGDFLKFKVDQNTPDLFYFFEEASTSEFGTSIIFDDLTYHIAYSDLKNFLELTFKFIELPIYLNEERIKTNGLIENSDCRQLIESSIKTEYRTLLHMNYEAVQVEFDNDEMLGWAVMFVPKYISFEDIRHWKKKGLNYYSQGVYICGGTSFIGEINYKKGLPLKIDRNGFEESDQKNFLEDTIYAEVYIKGFQKAMIPPPVFTHFFLQNYAGGHKSHNELYKRDEYLYPFVFYHGKHIVRSLKEISESSQDVELITTMLPDSSKEAIEKSLTSESLIIPVVRIFSDYFYIQYFKFIGHYASIRNNDTTTFLSFKKNKESSDDSVKNKISIHQCEFIAFQDSLLCTTFSHTAYFNTNNKMTQYLFSISENSENKHVTDDLIQLFTDIGRAITSAFGGLFGAHGQAHLLIFNLRLQEINSKANTDFVIRKEEFPLWMRPYIL